MIIPVVYLPALLLEGIEGKTFRPTALTVISAAQLACLFDHDVLAFRIATASCVGMLKTAEFCGALLVQQHPVALKNWPRAPSKPRRESFACGVDPTLRKVLDRVVAANSSTTVSLAAADCAACQPQRATRAHRVPESTGWRLHWYW